MIKIYGEPKGKGRPRFARIGNYVKTYTPDDTISYENLVKVSYYSQGGQYFEKEPLRVIIHAFFGIPKSTSSKKRKEMLELKIRPTKKPDADNIAKIILDALNGVAFKDDTQVVELIVSKYYGAEPQVMLDISKIAID